MAMNENQILSIIGRKIVKAEYAFNEDNKTATLFLILDDGRELRIRSEVTIEPGKVQS